MKGEYVNNGLARVPLVPVPIPWPPSWLADYTTKTDSVLAAQAEHRGMAVPDPDSGGHGDAWEHPLGVAAFRKQQVAIITDTAQVAQPDNPDDPTGARKWLARFSANFKPQKVGPK